MMRIFRKCMGEENEGEDAEHGDGALLLEVWRCLDARETAVFVDLVPSLRDLDAPRPSRASSPRPNTCPSGDTCSEAETLLLRACLLGAYEEVKALLRHGADPNRACSIGYVPLHHCAWACSLECLRALLEDSRTDVNARSDDGRDALHVCVRKPSLEEEENILLLKCIETLLKHPNFLANKVDFLAQPPLIYALNRYYEDRVSVMLKYGKGKIDLDWRMNRGQSLRKIIKEKFPNLAPLMPSSTEELPIKNGADPNERLLAYLKKNDLHMFKNILSEGKMDLNYLYGDPFHGTLIEIASRARGFAYFVEVLLKEGANPNTVNEIDKFPLIHQAAFCANYEVLKMLLETNSLDITKVNSYNETVLHVATRISPTHEEMEELEDVIELLLDFRRESGNHIDVNAKDKGGDTALFNATSFGLDPIVLQLLRRGADMAVSGDSGDPLIVNIDKDTLRAHLDEQISSNGLSQRCEMSQLVFRYDSLVPTPSDNDVLAEMKLINAIADSEDFRPFLRHPLISAFLFLKWKNVKTFVVLNLIISFLFVISLTSYTLLLRNASIDDETNTACADLIKVEMHRKSLEDSMESHVQEYFVNASETTFMGKVVERVDKNSTNCVYWAENGDKEGRLELKLLRIPIFLFLILMLIREGSQFFFHKFRYFLSLENLMELLLIFGTAVTVFSPLIDDSWDRHVSGVVILLAWGELILVSGGLPIFSIQLEMFKEVTCTFLRFMAWYSLMILAFGFSFFILFYAEDSVFVHPGISVFKTIIMMTGEFDSSDLPFNEVRVTSHLIFIVFVCLIAIVLLNLLSGLAVYDTQAIQEDAAVLSLVSMVRIVNYVENFLQKLVLIGEKFKLRKIKRNLQRKIQIFDLPNVKKQFIVFVSGGKIDFLLDSRTTRNFKHFELDENILDSAREIVINRNQQNQDVQGVIKELAEELKKIQRKQGELLQKLNTVEKAVKNINNKY